MFELVCCVVPSCGSFGDFSSGDSEYGRVELDLSFVSNVHRSVGSVRVLALVLLEPHGVVGRFVLVINAEAEVGFEGSPWGSLAHTSGLSELTNMGGGTVAESALVLAQDEVRCLQVVHHHVGLVLIKLAFMGLRAKLSTTDRLLEA